MTGQWFCGVYCDAAYIANWQKQNSAKCAWRTMPAAQNQAAPVSSVGTVTTALHDYTKSGPEFKAADCVPTASKKRTAENGASENDEDVVLAPTKRTSRKPSNRKHKKPSSLKQHMKPRTEEEDGESTQDDEKSSTAQKPKETPGPQTLNEDWWQNTISKHVLQPVMACPADVSSSNARFHGQRILYLRTMYCVKRMSDGSAVGDAKICQRVRHCCFSF